MQRGKDVRDSHGCTHNRPNGRYGEFAMKMIMICVTVLGCASLVGVASARAQMQPTDQDKQFLTTASQSDYNEMAFSKLALQKSDNPQVKAFAQKMITDHTRLEEQMKPFADKWGLTPATSLGPDHQQKYDQLQSLSGGDFNKQYMSDMTTDHQTALDAFKSEESSTQLPKFKTAVAKGEKVVAHHLEMAKNEDGKLGVTAGM